MKMYKDLTTGLCYKSRAAYERSLQTMTGCSRVQARYAMTKLIKNNVFRPMTLREWIDTNNDKKVR